MNRKKICELCIIDAINSHKDYNSIYEALENRLSHMLENSDKEWVNPIDRFSKELCRGCHYQMENLVLK